MFLCEKLHFLLNESMTFALYMLNCTVSLYSWSSLVSDLCVQNTNSQFLFWLPTVYAFLTGGGGVCVRCWSTTRLQTRLRSVEISGQPLGCLSYFKLTIYLVTPTGQSRWPPSRMCWRFLRTGERQSPWPLALHACSVGISWLLFDCAKCFYTPGCDLALCK